MLVEVLLPLLLLVANCSEVAPVIYSITKTGTITHLPLLGTQNPEHLNSDFHLYKILMSAPGRFFFFFVDILGEWELVYQLKCV